MHDRRLMHKSRRPSTILRRGSLRSSSLNNETTKYDERIKLIYDWNLEGLKNDVENYPEIGFSGANGTKSDNYSTFLVIATHALSTTADEEKRNDTDILKYVLERLKVENGNGSEGFEKFKKELDSQNEIGNSALMIAAEFGNLEVVKILHKAGASLTLAQEAEGKYKYKHTALILACENNHRDVAEYILRSDPSTRDVKNKYEKDALLMAVEFGSFECVKMLLDDFNANIDTNSKGRSCVMYSCFNTRAHHAILDLLLEKGARVGPGVMHWAAQHGSVHAVTKFMTEKFKHQVNIDEMRDRDMMTPLMIAAKGGHREVAKILIDNGAKRWIKRDKGEEEDSSTNFSYVARGQKENAFTNAFYLAIGYGHIELATECFMHQKAKLKIDAGEEGEEVEWTMLYSDARVLFSSDQLDIMATVYFRQDRLEVLVRLAARYQFHFELFMLLFPRFSSLNIVLNVGLKLFMETLRNEKLIHRYHHEVTRESHEVIRPRTKDSGWSDEEWDRILMGTDIVLIYKLTMVLSTIKSAQSTHRLEFLELQEYYNKVNDMVDQIFECSIMSKSSHVNDALCYLSDTQNLEFRERFIDPHIRLAYAFRNGPIALSLNTNTTALFSSGQISIFVDNIFYSYLRTSSKDIEYTSQIGERIFAICRDLKLLKMHDEDVVKPLRTLTSELIHFRYNPSMMFFGEGLSKTFTLVLTALICLNESDHFGLENLEILLVLMTFSNILYEYGELVSGGVSDNHRFIPELFQFEYYFEDVWNYLDFITFLLLMFWCFGWYDRICLSLSAIFMSLGILRYLSVFESIGKLTIMLFAMVKDLIGFLVVFLLCLFGFTICIYGILHGKEFVEGCVELEACDPYFNSKWVSVITLFSATLGNFDLDLFGQSRIADVVLVLFVVLFTVTLLSLIVARMSASHDRIDENAFQEWQYSKARFTQDYLLIDEKNPMSMMPAPLNLFCILLLPFHSMELWNVERELGGKRKFTDLPHPLSILSFIFYPIRACMNRNSPHILPQKGEELRYEDIKPAISLCGTFSDRVLGFMMAFIAPSIELMMVISRLVLENGLHEYRVIMLILYLIALQPVLYFPYVLNLLGHVQSLLTEVNVSKRDDNNQMEYLIHYERQESFDRAPDPDHDCYKNEPYLQIKIVDGTLKENNNGEDARRPSLKFVLGTVEVTTKPSINTTNPLLWNDSDIKLPLKDLEYLSTHFMIQILDGDKVLAQGKWGENEGTQRGENKNTTKDLRKLITNNRLEDEIYLYKMSGGERREEKKTAKKKKACIRVVLKAMNLGALGHTLWKQNEDSGKENPKILKMKTKRLLGVSTSEPTESISAMNDGTVDELFLEELNSAWRADNIFLKLKFPKEDLYEIFSPMIPKPAAADELGAAKKEIERLKWQLEKERMGQEEKNIIADIMKRSSIGDKLAPVQAYHYHESERLKDDVTLEAVLEDEDTRMFPIKEAERLAARKPTAREMEIIEIKRAKADKKKQEKGSR